MELPLALLSLFLGTAPLDSPVIFWATDSGVPRVDHGAALLPDGRVMVLGYAARYAQLYEPASDEWGDGGTPLSGHAIYSLARLRDGKVIAVDNTTYEWWSPSLPDWEAAPTGAFRQQGVAVLLSSGRMLTGCGDDGSNPISPFEIFDQDAGTWLDAGAQLVPGSLCALSPLPGDRWLKTGGAGTAAGVAELWSLDGGQATALQFARTSHASIVLPDGRVLVTGGNDVPVPVEIYDPVGDQWSTGAVPSVERFRASATVLPDGRVLVAGGFDGSNAALDTGEIYDPVTGLWSPPFLLGLRRGSHIGLMLPNGRVFLTGGDDNVDATQSSQLLDFSSPFLNGAPAPPPVLSAPRLSTTARGTPVLWDDQGTVAYRLDSQGGWAALPPAPSNHGAVAVALRDGRLLRVGPSIDGYDPGQDAWFTVPGAPDGGRPGAAAALLGSGEVLIAGGDGPSALVQRFDPRTATWTQTEDLPRPTGGGQAVSLPGGDVMVCGGDTAVGVTDWCWVYTASTSHWTFGVRFFSPRRRFSLTALESGRVLVAGGENDAGLVGGAEVFIPSSVSWVPAAPLLEARSGHAAVRLRNGQVLVIGGGGANGALATTELFDPLPRAFSAGPSLSGPRASPAAAMTAGGQVLIGGAEDARFELFDEGRGAQAEWLPSLGTPPRGAAGQAATVPGALLTGVTPGSSGDLRNSPSDLPVLAMVGPDDLLVRPGALGWTPASVTLLVPPATATGWYTLSASVNGIEGNAQPFAVGQDLGQACDAGADCAAGTCTAGTCAAPPEIIWMPPDAGADAGTDAGTDAGNDGGADAGPPSSLGVGCGCTAAPGAWAALLLVVTALGYRRRSLNARSRVPSARDDVTHSSISGST